MKTSAVAALRVIFGLFYLLNGLNFFFQFFVIPPPHNATAILLMQGFVTSGMFDFVKIAEVLSGLLLIGNAFVPLTLVAMFPITVIIGYIDICILGMEDAGVFMGGFLFVVHSILLILYLPHYRTMLVRRGYPMGTGLDQRL